MRVARFFTAGAILATPAKEASRENGLSESRLSQSQSMPSCFAIDIDSTLNQMFGNSSKYSSSSFVPPSPLPTCFSDSTNSIRSIHLTIL